MEYANNLLHTLIHHMCISSQHYGTSSTSIDVLSPPDKTYLMQILNYKHPHGLREEHIKVTSAILHDISKQAGVHGDTFYKP